MDKKKKDKFGRDIPNDKMSGLLKELQDKFGSLRITSRKRKKGALSNDFSHHEEGQAIDLGPEHYEVFDYLMNTKEGLELANKYEVGIIDETGKSKEKAKHATGDHFHIGMDSSYYARTQRRLNRITRKENKGKTLSKVVPKIVSEHPDYVKGQKFKGEIFSPKVLEEKTKYALKNYPEGYLPNKVKKGTNAYKTAFKEGLFIDYENALPEVNLNAKKMTPEEKQKKEDNELLKQAFNSSYVGGQSSRKDMDAAMMKFADAFEAGTDEDPKPKKMALKKSAKNTPAEQRIIDNLKAGIGGVETGGEVAAGRDPYKAYNRTPLTKDGVIQYDDNGKPLPASSARGKYQFLKVWLGDKNENSKIRTNANGEVVLGIIDWATNKDFGNSLEPYMNKDKDGNLVPIKNMDDFANKPELQEAYFNYYAKAVLIPEGNKILTGENPLGLSLDQAYAAVHFQGYSNAKKQINSGELADKTKSNLSVSGYLDKYASVLEKENKGLVTSAEIISMKKDDDANGSLSNDEKVIDKNNGEIKETFKKRNKDIDEGIRNGNLDPAAAEKIRRDLHQEYIDNGNMSIANEAIEELNIEKEEKFNEVQKLVNLSKKVGYKTESSLLAKLDTLNPRSDFYGTGKESTIGDKGFTTDATEEEIELAKKYGLTTTNYEKGKLLINPNKLFEQINSQTEELTGEKFDYAKSLKLGTSFGDSLKQGFSDFISNEDWNSYGNITSAGEISKPGMYSKIDLSSGIYTKPTSVSQKSATSGEPDYKDDNWDPNAGKPGPLAPKEKQEPVKDNYTDIFLNEQLGLNSVGPEQYNLGDQKREIPYDAIAGIGMGLIGNKMAREAKIPLRTEEVSEAVKNYTAELSKQAHLGLPVEVQAQMKNQLADAYQGGLEQIVNASAGNRATVLGNLGQLESAKSKGLVAMGVANYQAKQRAFAQYGQAIQYMDQFDANRDIANHGIKYTEAQRKRQAGRDVATAGMQKLAESLQYQKENGPGSANAMYKSLLMQKMFGFDPMMKDNGLGDTKGTKSHFDRLGKEKEEKLGMFEGLAERRSKLNAKQLKIADMVMENNGSAQNLSMTLDWLEKNQNFDPKNIDMNRISTAIAMNDFSFLSKDSLVFEDGTGGYIVPPETGLSNSSASADPSAPASTNQSILPQNRSTAQSVVSGNRLIPSGVDSFAEQGVLGYDSDLDSQQINPENKVKQWQDKQLEKLANDKIGQDQKDYLTEVEDIVGQPPKINTLLNTNYPLTGSPRSADAPDNLQLPQPVNQNKTQEEQMMEMMHKMTNLGI